MKGPYTWTQYKYPDGRLKLYFSGLIPITSATTTNVTLEYPTNFVANSVEPHYVIAQNNNIIGNRNGYCFVTNSSTADSHEKVLIRYVATAAGVAGNCWTSIVAEGRWA